MKNKILIICVSMMLFIACNNNDERESIGDKIEWSVLQNIEYKLREQKNTEFKIIENKGYYIAIIPNENEAGVIAILLNPDSPPFYKQMPNKQFDLSKERYEKILASDRVTSTVEEVLKSHVIE